MRTRWTFGKAEKKIGFNGLRLILYFNVTSYTNTLVSKKSGFAKALEAFG